jgi:hypothetical protein
MRVRHAIVASVFLMLGVFIHSADAMTIVAIPGTVHDATSVVDTVTSIDMVGNLQLVATFLGGSTETLIWGVIPDPCGGSCPGYRGVEPASGWSLIGAGNTLAMLWQYKQGNAPAITSLSFSGTNLAFDRTLPNPGTTGSFAGHDFAPDTNGDGVVDNPAWAVTYSDAIGLNGAAPVGDLYARLNVDFGTSGYAGNFNFLQDTDTYVPAAINPGGGDGGGGGGTPVPEPASIVLLGGGLLGLVAGRRRLFSC